MRFPAGVDVKVPNIYKITPTMRDMVQTAAQQQQQSDDYLDNSQKVVNFFGLPLRDGRSNPNGVVGAANANANANAATTANTSTISSSTRSGLTNGSALFEKQNGSNVSFLSTTTMTTTPVTAGAAATAAEGMETPVSKGGIDTEEWIPGGSQGETIEPPLAPSRKHRTMPAHMDYASEPPPKMRTARTKSSRTKSRTEGHEEGAGGTGTTTGRSTREASVVSASYSQSERERKRTVSGQPVEPPNLQRRSARLGNQGRVVATRATSSIPTLGVKEPREIKKVRSAASRSRTASASSSATVAAAAAAASSVAGSSTSRRTASGSSRNIPDGSEDPGAASGTSWSQAHQQAVNNSMKTSHQQQAQAPLPPPPAPPQPPVIDWTKDLEAVAYILELFAQLAGGYFALSKYKCREAIQIFNALPTAQRDAPWVLAQYGKAYYEQAMYPEAEKYFARVRANAPAMLDDMEIYSTVLWHLKDEVELAYLAHELMDIDRLSPEAWCAIGNSFSLQQEHDQALKCFKRATQLDPRFAYGFTLQGHEYVANEEHEKALDAYRQGIAANSRLYNAWYGLGKVYERLGKLDYALRHFHAACSINPTNSVLVTCIAALHERAGDYEAAEMQSTRSVNLAPQSVYARLRKARVLMKLRKLNEALAELMVLKDMAPDEVQVYELLGRLYKMTGDKGNMIKHFTTAMNLDPRAAQYLKEIMENSDDDFFDDDEVMT